MISWFLIFKSFKSYLLVCIEGALLAEWLKPLTSDHNQLNAADIGSSHDTNLYH
jgi:hypothetical protein